MRKSIKFNVFIPLMSGVPPITGVYPVVGRAFGAPVGVPRVKGGLYALIGLFALLQLLL